MDDAHRIASLQAALEEQAGRAAWHYELLTQCENRVIQRDAEIARLRLTEAEREAIASAIEWCEDITYGGPNDEEAAATLRALLKRTTL
jgi:hypothetical protein